MTQSNGEEMGALQNEGQNGIDQLDWLGLDSRRIERALDRAEKGPLWLADARIAKIVSASIHFRDGKVYRLEAYCIMPNHVHLLITPLTSRNQGNHQVQTYPLSSILHSSKRYTARKANRVMGREGPFWQHESYDHCVRDETDWYRIVDYIIQNPVRARFVDDWRMWRWTFLRHDMTE